MRHEIRFFMNEYVIPYNMTVYQAIRNSNLNKTGMGFFFLLNSNFT